MVPILTHHLSANALTEEAYQYALNRFGGESKLTAENMTEANEQIRTQINTRLPSTYQSTDITNFTVKIDENSDVGTIGDTVAGRYAAVLAAMPIAAGRFNPGLASPAVAFIAQLASDLADDGLLNGSDGAQGANAYDAPTLQQYLQTGVCTAVAIWGSLKDRPASPIPGTAAVNQLTLLTGSAGGGGNCDGQGPLARFSDPHGTAVDAQGNVYVADRYNNSIRKVTPSNIVTTIAGTIGAPGSTDGTGAAARFNRPLGIAVDQSDNLYVTDSGNYTIRKITAPGIVTTIAGQAGTQGTDNGLGSAAHFREPYGVVVDSAQNLYVTDRSAHTVRKISSAGNVTTLAGQADSSGADNGPGSMARFSFPQGIALDSVGKLYVSDSGNQTIRSIAPDGTVTLLAGQSGQPGNLDADLSTSQFSMPDGISVDSSGSLFVVDSSGSTVRKIILSPGSAAVRIMVGQAGVFGFADGFGGQAQFNNASGISIDTNGNLYLADLGNDIIRKITAAGSVSTLAGLSPNFGARDGSSSEASFGGIFGIVSDGSGNLYATDTGNYLIRKIASDGTVSTIAGFKGTSEIQDGLGSTAGFRNVRGLTTDQLGNLFVVDFNSVRKVTSAGQVTTPYVLDHVGQLANIARDGGGNLFVADYGNHTIRKIAPDGSITTLAGQSGSAGSSDGPGAQALLNGPWGVAVNSAGEVYVADTGNHTIRKIAVTGEVTTLAGQAGSAGFADGKGGTAQFNLPKSIGLDSVGNLYVADKGNALLRKVTPSGEVSTVVGVPGSVGWQTGSLPASVGQLQGIAIVNDKLLALASGGGVFLATLP
jgi:sugar lactone lactonase YvrE